MALFIINNILLPGPPGDQPVGDLRAAKLAIFLGFVNGLVSPVYMQRCLCDGGYDNVEQQQMYYQLANFVVAMLGVALLLADSAFSMALLPPPVVQCMVWFAKVLTGCTAQFGLNILHLCLTVLYDRVILSFT